MKIRAAAYLVAGMIRHIKLPASAILGEETGARAAYLKFWLRTVPCFSYRPPRLRTEIDVDWELPAASHAVAVTVCHPIGYLARIPVVGKRWRGRCRN